MNCEDVRAKLRDFLEDSVSEASREEIRSHMLDCDSCEVYAEFLGTFASDLKRLGRIRVPFNLEAAVQNELNKSEETRSSLSLGFRIFLCCASLLVVVALIFVGSMQWNAEIEEKREKIRRETKEAMAASTFSNLERMEKMLSRTGASESPSRMTGRGQAPTVQQLKPFHWDLYFDGIDEKESFVEELERLSPQVEFRDSETRVLLLKDAPLRELMSRIDRFPKGEIKGPPLNFEGLPVSLKPVRVVLRLEADEGMAQVSKHWHLYFLMKNSYSLLRDFEDAGFKFLYQTPEFWVLELTVKQFEKLQKMAGKFTGLDVEDMTQEIDPPSDGQTLIRLSIYVAEG